MRLAQQLYERGLITYMRTDSTNLSSLALGSAKKFIIDQFGDEYSHPRQFKTHSKGAQEAHEAIRPTYLENADIEGTQQEKRLYALIWKRTVASQMADAKVMNTAIKVASDKRSELFSVQATQVLFDGFLKVYMEGSDEDSSDEEILLPELFEGTPMQAKSLSAECKFTSAPPRYSEATLVKKLEELGIGRPSTYAPTISTLTTGRGYIVKGDKDGVKEPVVNYTLKDGKISSSRKNETVGAEKGRLLPQEIGMVVSDFLVGHFGNIMDYDFTANVEKDFDQVADGKLTWNKVIADFYGPFHRRVDEAIRDRSFKNVSRTIGTDSEGNVYTAKFGQFGPFVQKGDGPGRQYASLGKGQLIENITLEEAIKLFSLPRTVGQYEGIEIIATKGRFGPYLKYGTTNVSLPRGVDPLKITLEESIKLIAEDKTKSSAKAVLKEFPASGIQIVNGRYGPYIKHAGKNYRIPKGTDLEALSEETCKKIIAG